MGLSSNQARFLSLTSRQVDLEYRMQQICQRRLRLSSELETVATQYNNAISNRKLYISTPTNTLQDLSLNNLAALGYKVIDNETGALVQNKPVTTPPPGQTVITSQAQFMDIVNNMNSGIGLNGNYILACDIDLSSYDTQGKALVNGAFTGTFDGDGYQISNLNINASNSNVGIFSSLGGSAKVDNLELDNININGGTISNLGALAGSISGSASVSNVKATNINIQGGTDSSNIGGLIGSMSGGSISNVSVDSTLDGAWNVGGIVGVITGGTISNSEASGQVNLTQSSTHTDQWQYDRMSGGVVGAAWGGSIDSCASSSDVYNAYHYAGGVAGIIGNSASITNSYATGDIVSVMGPSGSFAGDIRNNAYIADCYGSGTASGGSAGGFYAWNSSGSAYNGTINNSFYDSTNYTGGNFGAGADSTKWINSGALSSSDIANKTSAFNTITSSWDQNVWDMTGSTPTLKDCGYNEYVKNLETNLRGGKYSLVQDADMYTQSPITIDGTDYEKVDWRTVSCLNDDLYSGDDTAAEDKYEISTAQINSQDKKLQLEQTNLDTEYKAITSEKEAVKKILDTNAQSSFKYFS
jgi:hypothetical protein